MSSRKKQDGDERFLRVQKDPRFWEMPEKEHKIKIDKRFQSMFHDERFKVRYTVDKRGRPIHQTSTEDLKRFYKVSDSEDEDEEEEEDVKSGKEKKGKKAAAERSRGAEPVQGDEEDEQTAEEEDVDLGETDSSEEDEDEEEGSGEESGEEEDSDEDSDSEQDLARGKGNVETSSDEDDEDDVDVILRKEEEEIEHEWGELAKDAPRSDEVSARLAVCNMDWDRMKARDLLALLSSFVPKGGAVLAVKIYPSEFGKERLNKEQSEGPLELRALPDDSEDDDGEERVYREKMRDYQFKRLKYFYAVVECDSTDTAAKIYQECDGYEYESSCSVLDLRFVPDDVQFDDEPKDVATDVNLSSYTPKLFTSSANATSKVQLTWDETDNDRVSALNRKFNKDELLDMDFNAYLASSSEEEEEGGDGDAEAETSRPVAEEEKEEEKKKKRSEEQMSKYRELLKGIQDKERKLQEDRDMEMEITWVPGLKETTEQLVRRKLEGTDKLTPWEEFLHKKKDRKKQKKKKTQRTEGQEEDESSGDELPADVDLNDPFFSEELGAADTKKKLKKKKKQEEEERTAEEEEQLEKQKAEMSLLMDDGDEHKHFNYDEIVEQQNLSRRKRRRLQRKGEEPPEDDPFQVDVGDARFQAMFTSHLFNLDPSDPNYRRTRATQSILAEKQRRRGEEQRRVEERLAAAAEKRRDSDSEATSSKATDSSLTLLVKSIKNKTEQFQARKKHKLV